MIYLGNGMYSDAGYLQHYGVKGMRWGVRKDYNLANKIHKKASLKEPKITNDMRESARASKCKLYGLDHRLKTVESIARKNSTDGTNDIKDAVRYTAMADDSNFVKAYNSMKKELSKKGYSEIRCRNYFNLYKQGKAKHKSVQSVFKDKDGYLFEVQFQTPSSQNAKNKKVPLYEEARNPKTSDQRRKHLEIEMVKLAEKVNDPINVYRIKSYG